MKIVLNGEVRAVEEAATLDRLVEDLGGGSNGGRGVAVAVNGEVVPRGRWATTALMDDDRVEILRAVGGG